MQLGNLCHARCPDTYAQTDKHQHTESNLLCLPHCACCPPDSPIQPRPEQFYHQLQEFATRASLDKIAQLRRAAPETTVKFHAQTRLKTMEATKICAYYFHDIFKHLFEPAFSATQPACSPEIEVDKVLALVSALPCNPACTSACVCVCLCVLVAVSACVCLCVFASMPVCRCVL